MAQNQVAHAVEKIFTELKKFNQGDSYSFEKEIKKLRDQFTRDRMRLLSGYMNDPRQFAAYSTFHFPLHLPEVFWIFSQLIKRVNFITPQKVLDLGSGPGTASASAYLWFLAHHKKIPQQWTLVDLSRRALQCASKILPFPLNSIRSPLMKLHSTNQTENSDLILISHVLNEMGSGLKFRERKLDFIIKISNFLSEQGLLVIIEPPLKVPTLDLMWLRDEVSRFGAMEVLAPCPSTTFKCPMRVAKEGWCYAQPMREWAKLQMLCPWDDKLKKVAQINLTDPGFTYIVLARKGAYSQLKNTYIAVSDKMGNAGWICEGKKLSRGPVHFRGEYLEPALDKNKS